MKQTVLSASVSLVLLIAVGLGCGQFKNDETTVSGNRTSATAASTPEDDISGSYEISGTNENGAGAYRGTLSIARRGDVYQFSWDTAGKKYDGVGVRTGDTVGVAFASGDNGEGCGVVLYKMRENATLEGKAGYWGNNSSETETAKRIGGMDLDGDYEILGKNTQGKEYSGRLTIKPSGAGYRFSWMAGGNFEGFGIKQGDSIAAGIGGSKCGFVSYVRKPDGTLEGKWGGYGSTSVGTEIARKK